MTRQSCKPIRASINSSKAVLNESSLNRLKAAYCIAILESKDSGLPEQEQAFKDLLKENTSAEQPFNDDSLTMLYNQIEKRLR